MRRFASASVLAVEHVLAGIEGLVVDQDAVAASEDLPVSLELAQVEPIVDDVRRRRAVESSLAVAELVAFVLQLDGERFERVAAARVQLEDADQRFSLHRVGLHGLVPVVDVHVAEWRRPGGPALAHLLIEPLEHLGTQIVAVVLSDGGHDVERECPGRASAELVVDEGKP